MGTVTGWLAEGTEEWHGRRVARSVEEAAPRSRAVLTGVVGDVAASYGREVMAPVGTVGRGAAFDACLDDGTGTIVLRWVGRDAVPGVHPGAMLRVEGTVSDLHGRLVLLNPLYRFELPNRDRRDQPGSSLS